MLLFPDAFSKKTDKVVMQCYLYKRGEKMEIDVSFLEGTLAQQLFSASMLFELFLVHSESLQKCDFMVRKLNIRADISQITICFYQLTFVFRKASYRGIIAKGSQSFRHPPLFRSLGRALDTLRNFRVDPA